MKYPYIITITLIFVICLFSCSGTNSNEQKRSDSKTIKYSLPVPPPTIESVKGRSNYILSNVWTNLDISDTLALQDKDSFEQFLVNYLTIGFIGDDSAFRSSVRELYRSGHPKIIDYVAKFYDKYLDNPNSPLKQEMMNIPGADPQKKYTLAYLVADEALKNGHISFADSVIYSERVSLYPKNLPGTGANDFDFITSKNKIGSLHGLPNKKYTLLMFYNPGCHACELIENKIKTSEIINDLYQKGDLQLLMVYVDQNEILWKRYFKTMPKIAIVSWNKDQSINNKSLYDIRAIPNLYLLDSNKNIIFRDAPIELIEKYLSDHP